MRIKDNLMKDNDKIRTNLLGILLTAKERQRLNQKAQRSKLSVSSYARMVLQQSGVFRKDKPPKPNKQIQVIPKPVAQSSERASVFYGKN